MKFSEICARAIDVGAEDLDAAIRRGDWKFAERQARRLASVATLVSAILHDAGWRIAENGDWTFDAEPNRPPKLSTD